jgi:hypothetical protein
MVLTTHPQRDECPYVSALRSGTFVLRRGMEVAVKILLWIAVALMLGGAGMLIAEVGAAGLWIAVITVGIAIVAVDLRGPHNTVHH